MTIAADGVRAAAQREQEFHPTVDGRPISAWARRAVTLEATIGAVNAYESRLAALEVALAHPFPQGSS